MSPNWQVKKKSIEDLSENSKLALKSKYKRAKQALQEKFCLLLWSMLSTLSISVSDYGLEIAVRRFYLCNSQKANAVILGKKE